MRVPRWVMAVGVVVAGTGGGLYWLTLPPPTVTVVSWGEEYGRAQTLAMFHPYTDKSGVNVAVRTYGGGLKEIAQQVQSRTYEWDVVDLELEDAAAGCRQGLLERLDGINLPPGIDGSSAPRDFVPGALGPCWVGSMVYSQVIAFDNGRFVGNKPRSAADFFDLARFPGRRGLRDSGPKYNLELALIADGVAPWRIYPALATENGLNRAFAKLDTIKPAIVWWRRVSEPMELLARGEVAMTTGLNSRVFSIAAEPRFGTIWDGQLYQLDVFGIPMGHPNKDRGLDFIRFATAPRPLAGQSEWLPYGPARRSSIRLVGRNPQTREEMRRHLPTAPENFARALAIDHDWWAANGGRIQARWVDWRSTEPVSREINAGR
jgi:putative spermidine/putrescine transport system substrate-binding protein